MDSMERASKIYRGSSLTPSASAYRMVKKQMAARKEFVRCIQEELKPITKAGSFLDIGHLHTRRDFPDHVGHLGVFRLAGAVGVDGRMST